MCSRESNIFGLIFAASVFDKRMNDMDSIHINIAQCPLIIIIAVLSSPSHAITVFFLELNRLEAISIAQKTRLDAIYSVKAFLFVFYIFQHPVALFFAVITQN